MTTNRLAASLVLALFAPFLLAVPAHADEPVPAPQTPLEACEQTRDALEGEVSWWKGRAGSYEELYLSYLESHERMAGIAYQWQLRVVDQAATIEAQRQKIDRRDDDLAGLRAKVADLRARLRAARA